MKSVLLAAILCSCGNVAPLQTSDGGTSQGDATVGRSGDARGVPGSATVFSIVPEQGHVGESITILGRGLGTVGTVTLDGVVASVSSWTDEAIEVAVPDLYPADVEVRVLVGNEALTTGFRVRLVPALYINNDVNDPAMAGQNSLSILLFNEQTGGLQEHTNSPVAVGSLASNMGGCSSVLSIHEATRRVFASSNNRIAVLDIDPRDGSLSHVQGSPFNITGAEEIVRGTLVINQQGTHLFAATFPVGESNGSRIAAMSIDSATGALAHVAGSPFALSETNVANLALSPNDRFLYVRHSEGMLSYAVTNTGVLNAEKEVEGFESPDEFAQRRSSDQLAISVGRNVSTYSVGPVGNLSVVSSGDYLGTKGIAFSSDGSLLVVSVKKTGLSGELFLANGETLSSLNTLSLEEQFGSNSDVSCTVFSKDNRYVFALNPGESKVGVFSTANSVLAPISGSPFVRRGVDQASGMVATF